MIACENCGRDYDDNKFLECPTCEKERLQNIFCRKSDEKLKSRKNKSQVLVSKVWNEKIQTNRFIWLGALLIVSFFIPFLYFDPVQNKLNVLFTLFSDEFSEVSAKIFFIYPILAGIGVIILAIIGKEIYKYISLTTLGILPIFIPDFFIKYHFVEILGYLSIIAIYSGSRAAYFRPQSIGSRITCALAGSIYLLFLFLPILPKEIGRIPLLMPFFLIFISPHKLLTFLIGILSLSQIILLVPASILCLLEVKPKKHSNNPHRLVCKLWIWSIIIIICGTIITLLNIFRLFLIYVLIYESAPLIIDFLIGIKTALIYFPLFFIATLAASDLLIVAHDRANLKITESYSKSALKKYKIGISLRNNKNKIMLILCLITILFGITLGSIGKLKNKAVIEYDWNFSSETKYIREIKYSHSFLIYCAYSIIAFGFIGFVILAYLDIIKRIAIFSKGNKSGIGDKINEKADLQITAIKDSIHESSNYSSSEIQDDSIEDGQNSPE